MNFPTGKPICKSDGCDLPSVTKGFCKTCYCRDMRRRIKTGEHVPVKPKDKGCKRMGCNERHEALGFCRRHYDYFRKESKTKYARDYYRKYSRELAAERKVRYHTDPKYRARRLEASNKAYRKRRMKRKRELARNLAKIAARKANSPR